MEMRTHKERRVSLVKEHKDGMQGEKNEGQKDKDTFAKVKLREKAGLTHINTPLPKQWC